MKIPIQKGEHSDACTELYNIQYMSMFLIIVER